MRGKDMEIKELETDEMPQILKFYGQVIVQDERTEDAKIKFENDIAYAMEEDHMILAFEDKKIVGFLWSQIVEGKSGKTIDRVKMLLIHPERLGRGIAGQLMEEEREHAKKIGADVLNIETR
jgi:GNAT superfamily N-acetyltransferase